MSEYTFHLIEPKIISTQLDPAEFNKARMVDTVLRQKDIANYHGGYTYEIVDPYHDFSKLYSKFLSICNEIFGPLEYSSKHKHWCWANVYNRDTFKTNLHDHITTSTINGVFYLNIPKDCKPDEAGISFLINEVEEIYIPDEYELLIMPSGQRHAPQYHSSTEDRIAINMEICTVQDADQVYRLDRIYQACQPQKN